MVERDKPSRAAPTDAARRAERLAQALRANLKRRKDQARGRDAMTPSSQGTPADD